MTPVLNWILLVHSYDHIICNGQRKDYILLLTLICISYCTDGLVAWHLFFLILCWIYKTLKTLKMSGICSIMCYVINHAKQIFEFILTSSMSSSPIMPKHIMLTLPETTPISWSPIWVIKSQVMSFCVHNLFQIYPIFSQNLNFLWCIVQFDSEGQKGGFSVNHERLY